MLSDVSITSSDDASAGFENNEALPYSCVHVEDFIGNKRPKAPGS